MANFEFNTFVKGLFTDANPLTYPENTSQDELNFVLNKDGSRQRRLGLNYDDNPENVCSTPGMFSEYLWENVDSSGVTVLVVRRGFILYFHFVNEEGILPYFHTLNFTSNNTGNKTSPEDLPLSFTVGFGKLFVAGSQIVPFYVEIDLDTLSVSKENIKIEIRDLDGVETPFAPDFKPTAAQVTPQHIYNLKNQGWATPIKGTQKWRVKEGTGVCEYDEFTDSYSNIPAEVESYVDNTVKTAYEAYFTATEVYPSNNQIWTIGKDADDVFQADLLDKMDFGTSFAPKGRFVIDPFFQVREGLPTVQEPSRPSVVSFFSGRVFYAGLDTSSSITNLTTGHVFFSQVVSSNTRIGKCFQQADPTSEHISDLIEDDGGVIVIAGAGKILKMLELADMLIVIADNGVWAISGIDSSFNATGYSVTKVYDFGAISQEALYVESTIIFLSETDIVAISLNDQGYPTASSISAEAISRLYRNIPSTCKKALKTTYDRVTKTLMFLYSEDSLNPTSRDVLLSYNAELQAWYKYKYSLEEGSALSGLVYIKEGISTFSDVDVQVGSQDVMVGGEVVIVTEKVLLVATPQLRFIVCSGSVYKFAYMYDRGFKDFGDKDYESYLVTGINTFQDTMRNKQIEYIIVSLKRTEGMVSGEVVNESSCLLSTRWDFSESNTSNRWSKPQQAYRYKRFFLPTEAADFGYGHDVLQSKSKVRGTGKALSFVFESESGKDLHLYGWAVHMSGRRGV